MKRFAHIVTHLSLQDSDASVLAWTSIVARLAGSRRVTLLHPWHPLEIPAELKERYPWLLQPGIEISRERLDQLCSLHLDLDPAVHVDRLVLEGSPLALHLQILADTDADLVICGRTKEDWSLVEKLARKAPCSLLSVPADAPARFERVLVAVDHSQFSEGAVDVARAFALAGGAGLTLFHAFEVPYGHERALITRETFVEGLRTYNETRMAKLAEEVRARGIEPEIHLRESALPPAAIAAAVNAENHDLVVIGCRGRDAIYATLLGSTAEAILRECPAAVVAVKPKGPSSGIPQAMRGS